MIPARILARIIVVVRVPALGPCWEWQGARTKNGYGCVKWRGRVVYVHRLFLAWHRKKSLAGLVAAHRCDNKPCCRPSHLRPGTQSSNMTEWAWRRKLPQDITLLSEEQPSEEKARREECRRSNGPDRP